LIITRTPLRISFFGGGTDYPVYYRKHGGKILSTTISKYNYLTVRELPPFFDHKYRIRYFKSEYKNTIKEIEHPSVRECLKFLDFSKGIELVHTGDVPAMSGLGSSSAFSVGMLHSLYALKGEFVTKRKLAIEAIDIEQNRIGESVGSQDQVAAAFGGLNVIEFMKNGQINVTPVTISSQRIKDLEKSIVIFFTGISRSASEIAQTQILESENKIKELDLMKDMVDEAVGILYSKQRNLDDFGHLLNESWQLKRSITQKISNDFIDSVYERGIKAGAIGGKLLGAGGGGFIAFYVNERNRKRLIKQMSDLLHVPFHFDQMGSHIIHYSK
jgi:D-glycero-alpha-D-manno-heptose-7-phosphate kinase